MSPGSCSPPPSALLSHSLLYMGLLGIQTLVLTHVQKGLQPPLSHFSDGLDGFWLTLSLTQCSSKTNCSEFCLSLWGACLQVQHLQYGLLRHTFVFTYTFSTHWKQGSTSTVGFAGSPSPATWKPPWVRHKQTVNIRTERFDILHGQEVATWSKAGLSSAL